MYLLLCFLLTYYFNLFVNSFRLGKYPTLHVKLNNYGELTWYQIGFVDDFDDNPKQIKIRDVNYIVWKDSLDNYYCLYDYII